MRCGSGEGKICEHEDLTLHAAGNTSRKAENDDKTCSIAAVVLALIMLAVCSSLLLSVVVLSRLAAVLASPALQA